MNIRGEEKILGALSIVLCLTFVAVLIAERLSIISHQGTSFVVSLFTSFVFSCYLDVRCKLKLGFLSFEATLWRTVSLSTFLVAFGVLMALRSPLDFWRLLDIKFALVIVVWIVPLLILWILLFRNADGDRIKATNFAIIHSLFNVLILVFIALNNK